MESVDFSVNESKNMVSYDRSASEVRNLKSDSFQFRIDPSTANPGQEVGILEIKTSANGTILRRNESQSFPAGTFQKKKVDLNSQNYNVTLTKSSKDIRIGAYFF